MTERLTRTTVEFTRPFVLRGVDALQPSGSYEVETVEERLEGLAFVAYRRLSTTMALRGDQRALRSRQVVDVDPGELAAALAKDAEAADERT